MAIAALAACEAPSAPSAQLLPSSAFATAATPAHLVTGGGKLSDAARDFHETYAFTASVDGDGNVKGEITIRFDPAPEFHAQVTCLSVNANAAWIGAIITATHDAVNAPIGMELWLRIQDNGQGAAAPPDRISSVRLGFPAADCALQRPAGLPWILIDGNITVR